MSASDEVFAPGVPIKLADGSEARLRYGFLAIKELEDSFGSLDAMQQALSTEFQAGEGGQPKGKAVGLIWTLLKAGFLDLELSDTQLDRLIDMKQFGAYAEAISKALLQAFGENPGQDPKGKAKAPSSSSGSGVTTLPPRSSGAAMSNSRA